MYQLPPTLQQHQESAKQKILSVHQVVEDFRRRNSMGDLSGEQLIGISIEDILGLLGVGADYPHSESTSLQRSVTSLDRGLELSVALLDRIERSKTPSGVPLYADSHLWRIVFRAAMILAANRSSDPADPVLGPEYVNEQVGYLVSAIFASQQELAEVVDPSVALPAALNDYPNEYVDKMRRSAEEGMGDDFSKRKIDFLLATPGNRKAWWDEYLNLLKLAATRARFYAVLLGPADNRHHDIDLEVIHEFYEALGPFLRDAEMDIYRAQGLERPAVQVMGVQESRWLQQLYTQAELDMRKIDEIGFPTNRSQACAVVSARMQNFSCAFEFIGARVALHVASFARDDLLNTEGKGAA